MHQWTVTQLFCDMPATQQIARLPAFLSAGVPFTKKGWKASMTVAAVPPLAITSSCGTCGCRYCANLRVSAHHLRTRPLSRPDCNRRCASPIRHVSHPRHAIMLPTPYCLSLLTKINGRTVAMRRDIRHHSINVSAFLLVCDPTQYSPIFSTSIETVSAPLVFSVDRACV